MTTCEQVNKGAVCESDELSGGVLEYRPDLTGLDKGSRPFTFSVAFTFMTH